MNRQLFLLLFCLFVVMMGFGVSLPVLPFYARHLHPAGVSPQVIAIHITLLTSIYAFAQLIAAPFWGQWSDRVGRRPLILLGIAGSAIAQVLFGFASSLTMLYVVRAVGGLLSAAMLPAATAYVSDLTTERDRGQGMAWYGSAVSLGVIAGPALSGLTTREDLHFTFGVFDLKIENYAPPFFLTAVLTFLALLVALRWLPESLSPQSLKSASRSKLDWRNLGKKLSLLLGLTMIAQFGLIMFEAVFALYAQDKLGYGATQTGFVFMVCGSVMAVFQLIAVGYLSKYINEITQVAVGFAIMGTGIALLLFVRSFPLVLGTVALLAFGMALIVPNLTALISKRGNQHTGTVLGIQNSANSLGQVGGSMLGGVLFAWQVSAPYWFAAALLISTGLMLGWTKRTQQNQFS